MSSFLCKDNGGEFYRIFKLNGGDVVLCGTPGLRFSLHLTSVVSSEIE